jgi:molybdenum cofactor cytidylyltransferase
MSQSKIPNLKSKIPRVFAIVPAAGHSRRMGQPKLLLTVSGRSIIRRLIDALRAGGVTRVFVLVRETDPELQAELAGTDARVVLTADTPDMRASVVALLDVVEREESPRASDGWLLAPADHPLLEPGVIAELLAARQAGQTEILAPVHAGRRGHPTYLSWDLAGCVASIPVGEGVNRLLRDCAEQTREVPTASPEVLFDLDTPDDLERLRRRLAGV